MPCPYCVDGKCTKRCQCQDDEPQKKKGKKHKKKDKKKHKKKDKKKHKK